MGEIRMLKSKKESRDDFDKKYIQIVEFGKTLSLEMQSGLTLQRPL